MKFLAGLGLVVGAGALLQACGADAHSRKSNPVDGGGDAAPEESGGARNGSGGAGTGGAPKATGGAQASGGVRGIDGDAMPDGPGPASSDGGVTDASITVDASRDATPEAGPTYSCDGAAWPGCAALGFLADGGGTFPISTEGLVSFAFHRGAPPIADVGVVVDTCGDGCLLDNPQYTLTNGTVTVDLSTIAPNDLPSVILTLYVTDACGQFIAIDIRGDGSAFTMDTCHEFTPTLAAAPQ